MQQFTIIFAFLKGKKKRKNLPKKEKEFNKFHCNHLQCYLIFFMEKKEEKKFTKVRESICQMSLQPFTNIFQL